MVGAITDSGLKGAEGRIHSISKLATVGPNSFDLIRLASLFKGEFSLDWLMELSGLKARPVLARLREGVQAGDLIETDWGMFRFADEKRCQEFYDSIPQ